MKILSLDFETTDITLHPDSPDKKLASTAELSKRVLLLAVHQYANQVGGLIKSERSLYYSIVKMLERAVKDDLKEIEFPDDIFGFIRKIFRETKLPVDKVIEAVEKNIDAVIMA